MQHKPVQAVEQEQVVIYQHDEQSYYAEVSKESLEEHDDLMEQIIEHAFETLNVQHLDLRVIDSSEPAASHATLVAVVRRVFRRL